MESLKISLESILSTVQKLPEKDALVIFLFVRNVVESVEAYLASNETFEIDTLLSECCQGFQQADDVLVHKREEGIQVDTVVENQVTQSYQLTKNKTQLTLVKGDEQQGNNDGTETTDGSYYVSMPPENAEQPGPDQPQTVLECSDPSVLQAFLEEGGKLPSYLPPGTQIIIETEDGRTEVLENKAQVNTEPGQEEAAAVASIDTINTPNQMVNNAADEEDNENMPVFVMTEEGEMLLSSDDLPELNQATLDTTSKRKISQTSPSAAKKIKLDGSEKKEGTGAYQCDKCFQKFNHEHSLHRHYRSQHLQMKWTCDTCGREFTRADSLVNHKKNGSCFKGPGKHKKPAPGEAEPDLQNQSMEGTSGSASGDSSPRKKKNVANKSNDGSFLCQQCGQCLNSKQALQMHMRKHTGVVPFKCQFCGHGTNSRANLLKHLDNIHGVKEGDPNVKLDLRDHSKLDGYDDDDWCADEMDELDPGETVDQTPADDGGQSSQHRVIVNTTELYNSGQLEIPPPARYLRDSVPDTHYVSSEQLSELQLREYQTPDDKSPRKPRRSIDNIEPVCSVCGKVFHNHSNLTVHMRTHTKDHPYECEFCGKTFPTKMNMTRHVQTVHEGRRDFPCDICGKRFGEKKTLTTHRLVVHEGKKPYPCELCPQGFSQRGSLNMHMMTHTLEGEKHECSICDRAFTTKYALAAHVKLHGEDDYECDECELNFVSQTDLRRHVKATHSDDNTVTCDLCCKKFANKEDFSIHLKNQHTKEKPFRCQICPDVSFYSNNSLQRHMLKEHPEGFSPPTKSSSEIPNIIKENVEPSTMNAESVAD